MCTESHNVPDMQILCCSVLKMGQKYFSPKFRTCTSMSRQETPGRIRCRRVSSTLANRETPVKTVSPD